jgi:hypothetical protein
VLDAEYETVLPRHSHHLRELRCGTVLQAAKRRHVDLFSGCEMHVSTLTWQARDGRQVCAEDVDQTLAAGSSSRCVDPDDDLHNNGHACRCQIMRDGLERGAQSSFVKTTCLSWN